MNAALNERSNKRRVTRNASLEVKEKDLNYWLMENTNLMEKLSVLQPACWAEADGYKE